jgi:hypothetical protein
VTEPLDLADEIALLDLQRRYGDVVSRRAWDELAGLLEPECELHLALRDGDRALRGADAVIAFVSSAVSAFEVFLFSVQNAVVGPGPTGRMWIHELRWGADGERTDAHGLYEDEFARGGDGGWRFATRRYTSISGGRFRPSISS